MRVNRTTLRLVATAALLLAGGCAATPATAPASGPAEAKVTNVAYTSMTMIDFDAGVQMAAEGRYSEAIMKLSTIMPVFEHSGEAKNAAECAFWMGFCEEKLGHYQLAANHFKKVLNQYPSQPAAKPAKEHLDGLPALNPKPTD